MNNFRIILIGLISALGLYLIIYAVLFTMCILSNRNELIKETDEASLKPYLSESMQKSIQEEIELSMKEKIELFKQIVVINENIKHQKLFQFVIKSLISIQVVLAAICILFIILMVTSFFIHK